MMQNFRAVKKILSMLVVLVMVFGMLPITTFAATKLPTPTNVEWEDKNGTAGWDPVANSGNPDPTDGAYSLVLYKNGENFSLGGISTVANNSRQNSRFADRINESGTYYFTVAANGNGTDYTQSDFVQSNDFVYVKPNAQLDKATNLRWDIRGTAEAPEYVPVWDEPANAGTKDYYRVYLYKNGENLTGSYFKETITGEEPWIGRQVKTDGVYTFKVKAISSRISEIITGEWSDLSEPLIIGGAPSITTQPAAETTVTEGSISGTLSTTATVGEGKKLGYQWYSNTSASNDGGEKISGATSASFDIPTDLTTGVYYYFCEVSATDAVSIRSNVAKVIVNPGVPTVTATDDPSVVSDNPIKLDVNGVKKAYISISLGTSNIATSATVAVEGDAVSVDTETLASYGNVLVTAENEGTAEISIVFGGIDGYNKTITANVVKSSTPPVQNTHTITVSAGSGGSISPAGSVTVNEGENQTFTITANSNYKISNVLVDGVSVGAVSSYTFSNVTGNHSIAASFTYAGGGFISGGGFSGGSGGSGGSGVSGGSRGAGGSRSVSNDTTTTTTTAAAINTPTDLTTSAAQSAAQTAAQAAKASGASTATVSIKNPGNISLAALQAMVKAAGMPVNLNADSISTDGKTVEVRITLDPNKSTKDLNLTVSTTNATAKVRKDFFQQYFSNNVFVVSFGQQGSFGQAVDIAVKIDPAMKTENLVFYSYDKSDNSYNRIEKPAHWIDKNGYVHFTTVVAGDIIISDGALQKK